MVMVVAARSKSRRPDLEEYHSNAQTMCARHTTHVGQSKQSGENRDLVRRPRGKG